MKIIKLVALVYLLFIVSCGKKDDAPTTASNAPAEPSIVFPSNLSLDWAQNNREVRKVCYSMYKRYEEIQTYKKDHYNNFQGTILNELNSLILNTLKFEYENRIILRPCMLYSEKRKENINIMSEFSSNIKPFQDVEDEPSLTLVCRDEIVSLIQKNSNYKFGMKSTDLVMNQNLSPNLAQDLRDNLIDGIQASVGCALISYDQFSLYEDGFIYINDAFLNSI